MLIINFSHPLTPIQLQRITDLTQQTADRVIDIRVQFDQSLPFSDQVRKMVDASGVSSVDWQTTPILVNPPGHCAAAVILLAELHGRMGFFPPIVRLCPRPNSIPPVYEVAEIINLQLVRDSSRTCR